MPSCAICLLQTTDDTEYHPACIDMLFDTSSLPSLKVNVQELYALAAKMAGKMSISGVQEKVSLTLSKDKRSLEVTASGGRYILKPEPHRYSSVPQIEHLTMRLASLTSIEVPPFGLMRLSDGSLAYVIKRFDRLDDGAKLQVEYFCQLSEKPIRDKYQGSAELCVRLLRTHASSGTEKGTLDQADLSFHEREYERLRTELVEAFAQSDLPEQPSGAAALNNLLVRTRLGGSSIDRERTARHAK